MATDSFTSAANGISSAVATLTQPSAGKGSSVFTRHGFEARVNPAGVTVSKASALGAAQSALTFPLSRYDAQELALLLLSCTD
jgi:hypothetical protein